MLLHWSSCTPDSDFTVWYYSGLGTPTLSGNTYASLGAGWNLLGSYDGASSPGTTTFANSNYSSYWLIGAYNELVGGSKTGTLDSRRRCFQNRKSDRRLCAPRHSRLRRRRKYRWCARARHAVVDGRGFDRVGPHHPPASGSRRIDPFILQNRAPPSAGLFCFSAQRNAKKMADKIGGATCQGADGQHAKASLNGVSAGKQAKGSRRQRIVPSLSTRRCHRARLPLTKTGRARGERWRQRKTPRRTTVQRQRASPVRRG